MWTRKELKTWAKEALQRNYWKIVLVSFLSLLFCGGLSAGTGWSKGAASDMSGYQQQAPAAPVQKPAPTSAIGDGFMNIPDGVEDEGLPFN